MAEQFLLKKNEEPQNGVKDCSPGEGNPERVTHPWVCEEMGGNC